MRPTFQQFAIRSDKADVLARLKPAKPLVVRVVDPKGQPLPNSRLFIQQWRNGHLLDWDARTDAQGRVVWNEAPEDTVYYCVSHDGYIQLLQNLVATGVEQTVTLVPELKFSGVVLDDKTGLPLTNFHIVTGWVSRGRPPFWERQGNQPPANHPGGNFEITEALEREGYAVRVEADGYLPAESQVFHSTDDHPSFTFRLKKAADITQALITADGRPLEGAERTRGQRLQSDLHQERCARSKYLHRAHKD